MTRFPLPAAGGFIEHLPEIEPEMIDRSEYSEFESEAINNAVEVMRKDYDPAIYGEPEIVGYSIGADGTAYIAARIWRKAGSGNDSHLEPELKLFLY